MSLIRPDSDESVIACSAEAEVIGQAPIVRLSTDSSSTGGPLSTHRVTLAGDADGAKPTAADLVAHHA